MTRPSGRPVRASRQARPGRTFRTTGAVPTAASARSSTSSPSTAAQREHVMTDQPVRLPYQTAARNLLYETIMTAVDDLVRSRGWSATTMSDVAGAAGVSRQTLYNEFGSRSALVEAYVTREIEQLIAEVTEA